MNTIIEKIRAMKAPDKIYVCIPQRLNLSTFKEDSKYVGMAYNDKGNLRSPQIEEYIRKDALLEWAKECTDSFNEQMKDLKQTDIAYRVICGGLSTIELLLNKLNEI